MTPARWAPMVGVLLLFLAACRGEDAFQYATLCKATGTLMINGEPATGAMLIFVPANGESGIDARGTRPRAVVDSDGRFQVMSYVDGDGLPVGDYRVAVIWEEEPNTSAAWDKLDGRFARAEQTGINVTVHEGDNSFEAIKLEKVRVLNRPPKRQAPSADGID